MTINSRQAYRLLKRATQSWFKEAGFRAKGQSGLWIRPHENNRARKTNEATFGPEGQVSLGGAGIWPDSVGGGRNRRWPSETPEGARGCTGALASSWRVPRGEWSVGEGELRGGA